MSALNMKQTQDEIESICALLDNPALMSSSLASRVFHLADAIENAGPEDWALVPWSGYLRALTESGVAFDILGEGKSFLWAAREGLIEPAFRFEPHPHHSSPFEKMARRFPAIACSALSDPRHWGLWIQPGVERLGLDGDYLEPKFGAWLAGLPGNGVRAPLLTGEVEPALAPPSASHGVDAAFDQAEADGMLDFFKRSGRLESWAILCAIHGNEERLQRAVAAGADFSKLTAKQSWDLFTTLARSSGPAVQRLEALYGQATTKQTQESFAWDDQLKKRIWMIASEAGAPLARCEKSEFTPPHRLEYGHSANALNSLTRLEIERGGLRGPVAMRWLALMSMSAMDFKFFDGSHPVIWGLANGLCVEDLEKGALMDTAILSGQCGSKIDPLLIGLARLNAKLSGPERGEYANDDESLLGRLMHIGASPEAARSAIAIGVDWRARNASGDPALRQLFDLNRSGAYEPRLAAIIAAVGPNHVAELLAQTSKDGSSPMHWAARALCADSVQALSALGLDPNQKDAKGASAGHWAARKYVAGKAAKISATLAALTRCGQDWKALDAKGTSALAALCSKGPLEPVAALLEQEPAAFEAKERSGKSAKDALAIRGAQEPRAGALVEKAELSASVGQESALATKTKPKAQRI